MILGIGVDSVDVIRFAQWHTYSRKTLSRIFSPQEIDYCCKNISKSAERFAVRFAAREALYKALCVAYPHQKIPFLTLCAHTTISKINGVPCLGVRDIRDLDMSSFVFHLSLTHTSFVATAFVLIEKR